MKIKCDKCNLLATWNYMPGEADVYMCDLCVPRGCSCNLKYSDEVDEYSCAKPLLDEQGNYIEETDEQGRLFPCVEWSYSEFGFDEFDEDDEYHFMEQYPEYFEK